MEIKKLSIAVAFVAIASAIIAFLSNLVDKPADRGFIERFLGFLVIFTVMFVVTALWENRTKHPKR